MRAAIGLRALLVLIAHFPALITDKDFSNPGYEKRVLYFWIRKVYHINSRLRYEGNYMRKRSGCRIGRVVSAMGQVACHWLVFSNAGARNSA